MGKSLPLPLVLNMASLEHFYHLFSGQSDCQNIFRRLFSLTTWSLKHFLSPPFKSGQTTEHFSSPLPTHHMVMPYSLISSCSVQSFTVSLLTHCQMYDIYVRAAKHHLKVINPEDGNCNVCQNVEIPSIFYASYPPQKIQVIH
jgi:hypothetical protein